MSEIPGATIDWTDYFDPTLPRIIHIPEPLLEVSVQDLIDTVAAQQADLDNLIYAAINPVLNGGKQDLGGGLFVGLTTSLSNARISFDARKLSTAQGAVTTGDINGVTLNDASATFISDGIEPGAWVVNVTDASICSVIRVNSETQIITDGLADGTDDQWGIGDVYKIFNVEQGEVSEGNAVSTDYQGNPIKAILPTAGIQVIRSLDVSAALLDAAISGGLTPQQATQLEELWKMQALDPTDPLTKTPSEFSTQSRDIVIDVTGDGKTSSTGTRKP